MLHPAALLLCLSALAAPAGGREVPSLGRSPEVDGRLDDLRSSLVLSPVDASRATASFAAAVSARHETLYLGVRVTDDAFSPGDLLALSLHFPGAGPTAGGHTFRFAPDGKRPSEPESHTPAFVQEQVKLGVRREGDRLALEIAIPARAFPRLPRAGPLALELCVTYEDQDAVGEPPRRLSSCADGAPPGGPLLLPEGFRRVIAGGAPARVETLEARPHGWAGFDGEHPLPLWVRADGPMTLKLLRSLVTPGRSPSPQVPLPETLKLSTGELLLSAFAGNDPFAAQGPCATDRSLRLGLYRVRGRAAHRVLDWPIADCSLGMALSVALEEEDTLIIGYSSGAQVQFAWSEDRFERTEIGSR